MFIKVELRGITVVNPDTTLNPAARKYFWNMAMLKRAKIALLASIPFLLFFLFGITQKGQEILRGRIPPSATHWQMDDIVMGQVLHPLFTVSFQRSY